MSNQKSSCLSLLDAGLQAWATTPTLCLWSSFFQPHKRLWDGSSCGSGLHFPSSSWCWLLCEFVRLLAVWVENYPFMASAGVNWIICASLFCFSWAVPTFQTLIFFSGEELTKTNSSPSGGSFPVHNCFPCLRKTSQFDLILFVYLEDIFLSYMYMYVYPVWVCTHVRAVTKETRRGHQTP